MAQNSVTMNGRTLEFNEGETILEVARRHKIFIPTLCHLKGATPTGACRVCVVEIEGGRGLSAACATPAAKGMVILTSSKAVVKARQHVVAMLLQSGHHNCASRDQAAPDWTGFQERVAAYDGSSELCDVYSDCRLQALAYRYQVDSSFLTGVDAQYEAEEDASPLIKRDFSRCILCGRCIQACNEIQVNHAISHGFRGARAKIVTMGDNPLGRSDCVSCGECIQACPVGALVEKRSRYRIRPWETRHVRTTCHYCGVGCQLDLHVKDGTVMKVTGVEDALPNRGSLCVNGRFGFDFLTSPDRLTTPKIRENGKLRDATWEEALDLVAARMKKVKEQDGPDAIAAICSAKSTNEALYLTQKLLRAGIGTNNVASPFASTGMTNSLAELETAPCILLIGSDVTEENPVAAAMIKRAARAGRKLMVIDERPTKISEFATLHLRCAEATESVLVNGLIRQLFDRFDRDGFDELEETAKSFPLEKVARTTGVDPAAITRAAEMLDAAESVMLVYGTLTGGWGPVFERLQSVLGNNGTEHGGVNRLGDLNNSQGASDLGFLPEYLPGYRSVEKAEERAVFEKAWARTLSPTPGLTFPDILRAATGSDGVQPVKLLYCSGENLAIAAPAIPGLSKALENVEFLVAVDILDSKTLEHADVVLPAAAWSEDEGTYTSSERRVSLMRRAVAPPGEAKAETWIVSQLGRRLGLNESERTARQIWEDEIVGLVPQLAGITYGRIEGDGLQWPVAAPSGEGTPWHTDRPFPFVHTAWDALNYHHRTLAEHCDGLLESISRGRGVGTYLPPSNAKEVTGKFVAFLEAEDSADRKQEIDEILAEYRPKKGGLIPVLQKVQGILGFLPVEVQNYIALGLGLPASDVFGVVTFYSFFTMVPRGKHVIRVCLGTACFVKGSGKILDNLARHLDVEVGATTEDREFSLEVVRCIGACGLAPVMVVDENTHGMVALKDEVPLIEQYRGKE